MLAFITFSIDIKLTLFKYSFSDLYYYVSMQIFCKNWTNIQYVSSINLRVAHEILGCADAVLPYITFDKQMCHTLVISPPRCGKTTLLRDLVRQVSNGNKYVKGCTVGVVDERSELGDALWVLHRIKWG